MEKIIYLFRLSSEEFNSLELRVIDIDRFVFILLQIEDALGRTLDYNDIMSLRDDLVVGKTNDVEASLESWLYNLTYSEA